MGEQTLWDKVREWIGGICWDIFLWSARMTDAEYFKAMAAYYRMTDDLERASIEDLLKFEEGLEDGQS